MHALPGSAWLHILRVVCMLTIWTVHAFSNAETLMCSFLYDLYNSACVRFGTVLLRLKRHQGWLSGVFCCLPSSKC